MSRKFKYLFLALLLFLSPNVFVFASSEQEHILLVEDFSIDEEELFFKGYAFISHRDNYGKSGTKGNMRSFIVAYKGSWQTAYAGSECNNQLNESNCYSKATDVVARDMFYGRCISTGCNSNRTASASANSNYVFDDGSTCVANENCIYYNVGFSTTISLRYIVERFFGVPSFDASGDPDSQINFKLVTKIYNSSGNVVKTMSTDLGLYSGFCDVEGSNCWNDTVYGTGLGLYDIKFDGVSDVIKFDAEDARGKVYKDGEIKTLHIPLSGGGDAVPHFLDSDGSNNVLYKIIDSEANYTSVAYGGTYTDTFFKVESVMLNRNSGGGSPYTIVPKKGSGISLGAEGNSFVSNVFGCAGPAGCSVVPGAEYEDFWMLGNWGHLAANFKITKFKINVKPITCNDINGGRSNVTSRNNVNCDADGDNANASLYECSEYRSANSKAIESEIYIKLDSAPVCNADLYYQDASGNYYLPVTIKADVLVEQFGYFHFADFSPDVVKAGKGFSINNINNGISYKNIVSFVIANRFDTPYNSTFHDTPYISYVARDYKLDGGNCVLNDDFDLYSILETYYADTAHNNNNSKVYFIDSDNVLKNANTLNVALRTIGNSFVSTYAPSYEKGADNTIYKDLIKFSSCDSNSSSNVCDINSDIGGDWTTASDNSSFDYKFLTYSTRGYGLSYNSTYTYKLPYAYVALSDSSYNGIPFSFADVFYSDTFITDSNLQFVGNKYFVGFKYAYVDSTDFDFPFSFLNEEVSFVQDMSWELSGSCGVDVENGYYDFDGDCNGSGCDGNTNPLYRYRSISLSNPFPKFDISNYTSAAINWQDWYWGSNSANNQARLSNTYSHLDYSVSFLKNHSGSQLDIGDIVNCSSSGVDRFRCSNSYGSLANFSVDGNPEISNFVFNNFNPKASPNTYCGLGFFSKECDNLN